MSDLDEGVSGKAGHPSGMPRALLIGTGVVGIVLIGAVAATAIGNRDAGGCELDGGDASDVIEPAQARGPLVEGDRYSITLPTGWIGTDVDGDAASAATDLFPSDPELANMLRGSLDGLGGGEDLPDLVARDTSGRFDDHDGRPPILLVHHFADLDGCSVAEARDEMARDGEDAAVVELGGRLVARSVDTSDDLTPGVGITYLFPEERAGVFVAAPELFPGLLESADASAATLSAG